MKFNPTSLQSGRGERVGCGEGEGWEQWTGTMAEEQ